MSDPAIRAERMTLAVLNGEVSMDDVREDLQLAAREREVTRDAEALRTYREGGNVWAWPAVAPWSGF